MSTATPNTVAAQRRFADYAWYHQHLRIYDRDHRRLVPFRPRRAQVVFLNRVIAARREGRPFRGVILKARQLGFSTASQTLIATEAFTRSGVRAATVAHEEDASAALHSMVETMYDELPAALRPAKLQRHQGKQLVLEHGSWIRTRTAGNRESGRSWALTHLHLSEAAFYPAAQQTVLALMQTVQRKPGTYVVVESTPNGMAGVGQWFYDLVCASVEGRSGFEFFFFPWFDDPAYQIHDHDLTITDLDDEEHALQAAHGLSLAQLAWRRWCIRVNCQGRVDKFRQEYPATWREGFLATGRPFFDAHLVDRMHTWHPRRRGRIITRNHAAFSMRTPLVFEDRADAALEVLVAPIASHRYIVAVDPAGQVTDAEAGVFATPHDAEDYTAITVVDRHTQRVVAFWRDRVDLGLVAEVAAGIGRVYNNAMIAVEKTGGYGQVVLDGLKRVGYSNLYRREVHDEHGRRIGTKLGWDTTIQTRPMILERLRDVMRDHPEYAWPGVLQAEMRTFVRGRGGGAAAPGAHDDTIMSVAIGLEVAREHPQTTLAEAAT